MKEQKKIPSKEKVSIKPEKKLGHTAKQRTGKVSSRSGK